MRPAVDRFSRSNSVFPRVFSLLIAVSAVAVTVTPVLSAQKAEFLGARTNLISSSSFRPTGIATDSAGNAVVADNAEGTILRVEAKSHQRTTVASGLSDVRGIALDRKGDLYVVESSSGMVEKLTWTGSAFASPTRVAAGLKQPEGVAVDAAGEVFISEAGGVIRVPVSGAGFGEPVQIGTGLKSPQGIAFDAKGNLFVADRGLHQVLEMRRTAIGYAAPSALVSGLNAPWGVTLDLFGNLFLTDSGSNEVQKLAWTGTAFGKPKAVPIAFKAPNGIASDLHGTLFVSDVGNQAAITVQPNSVNFGPVNVCPGSQTTPVPCSATMVLSYNLTPYPEPVAINAVTMGVSNQDFTYNAAASSCVADGSGGENCQFSVTFKPKQVGARKGAFEVFEAGSGTQLAATPIYGTGEGPLLALGGLNGGLITPVARQFLSTLNVPLDFAVDDSGNVYLVASDPTDTVQNLYYIPASGAQPEILFTPVNHYIYSVLLDGAGNIYVEDETGLLELPAVGGAPFYVPNAGGSTAIRYAAIDGAGNLYECSSGHVSMLPAGGGAPVSLPFTGIVNCDGIAVDAGGDIFVDDFGGHAAYEMPAGTTNTVQRFKGDFGSGFISPNSMAVDSVGDIYLTNKYDVPSPGGNSVFAQVPASCADVIFHSSCGGFVSNSFNYAIQLKLDSAGNVYVLRTDPDTFYAIDKISSQAVAPFVFGSPTASNSVYGQAQISNIGTQPLLFPAPSTGTNPTYPTGYIPGSGTCPPTSLAPGTACYFVPSFGATTPGTYTGNFVFTDNSMNAIGATQKIAVTGTIPKATPVITWPIPTPITVGTPLSATQLDATASVPGKFTYSPAAGTVLPAGESTLTATFSPSDSVNNAVTIKQINLVVDNPIKLAPVITWATPAAIQYGTVLSATRLNATSVVPGTFTYSPVAGTRLGAGTQVLTATFKPSNPAEYATATFQTKIVVMPAPLTVTVSNASRFYGGANPLLIGAVTGSVYGDTFTTTYSSTATQASPVGSYPITVAVTGAHAVNYTIKTVPGTLTVNAAPLHLTAANAVMTYGQAVPALSYTTTGFVNGDTAAVLTGAPAETTTGTSTSAIGFYPITISQGTLTAANYSFTFTAGVLTIKAIGIAATPAINPPVGTFSTSLSVSISDSTPGAMIYYTTNGTVPTKASTLYTGSITVSATETIKAIAIAPGYTQSATAAANFVKR